MHDLYGNVGGEIRFCRQFRYAELDICSSSGLPGEVAGVNAYTAIQNLEEKRKDHIMLLVPHISVPNT